MILIALFIGAILVVAAVRNSQGALFTALATDVPAFVVWGAALLAIGAIGFVPALKPVSRGLLALVLTVLILANWSAIQAGILAAAGDTSTAATNAAAGAAAGAGGTVNPSSITPVANNLLSTALGGSSVSSWLDQGLNDAGASAGSSLADVGSLTAA
jgi:hypothetical protein